MPVFYPRCRAILSVLLHGADRPRVIEATPLEAEIGINSYQDPDSFALRFAPRVFGLDPDLVRAIGVELYLFDAGSRFVEDARHLSAETLELTGLVDEFGLSLDAAGGASLQGQDYTALLDAHEWPPGQAIPVGAPIDQVVKLLADEAVQSDQVGASLLSVVFEGDESMPDPPVVGEGMTRSFARGLPTAAKTTWGAIYDLALRHGAIAFVRRNDLVLAAPGALSPKTASRLRRVAYGRNLKSLESSRKLGHRAAPAVVASSFDSKTRRTIEARWPPTAPRRPSKSATGTRRDEVLRVTPPAGITDARALQAFARARHELESRHESEIKFTTRRLTDLDGNDLIRLRTGDPIWIAWNDFRADELRSMSEGARLARLRALGYADDVAELLAGAYSAVQNFDRPYYTRGVRKIWRSGDGAGDDLGLTLEVEAANYADPGEYAEPKTAREVIDEALAPVRQALDSPALAELLARPKVQ